jgi:uncharacterized lipoprotein NlpE involved in copper resistance
MVLPIPTSKLIFLGISQEQSQFRTSCTTNCTHSYKGPTSSYNLGGRRRSVTGALVTTCKEPSN